MNPTNLDRVLAYLDRDDAVFLRQTPSQKKSMQVDDCTDYVHDLITECRGLLARVQKLESQPPQPVPDDTAKWLQALNARIFNLEFAINWVRINVYSKSKFEANGTPVLCWSGSVLKHPTMPSPCPNGCEGHSTVSVLGQL